MDSAGKMLKRISVSAIWSACAIMTCVVFFTVSPIIETQHFPVISDINIQLVDVVNDKMLFRITGTKERDCSLVEPRILVQRFNSPIPVLGVMWADDIGDGPKTRALGYQDFGIWAVVPIGKKLKLEGIYKCHPFWDTRQVLGEWEYGKKDSALLPAR